MNVIFSCTIGRTAIEDTHGSVRFPDSVKDAWIGASRTLLDRFAESLFSSLGTSFPITTDMEEMLICIGHLVRDYPPQNVALQTASGFNHTICGWVVRVEVDIITSHVVVSAPGRMQIASTRLPTPAKRSAVAKRIAMRGGT